MAVIDINSSFVEHIVRIGQGLQAHLLIAVFDLLVGLLIIRLLVRAMRLILKFTHIQTGLRYVLTSIVETFLWIFLTITLLNELGFKDVLLPFAGSIAFIGIAMAAGGSILLSDIIAAIFLARDSDFNVGDEVKVGWDPQTQGIIERMDARRIRIRDKDGVLHVIPNSVVERKEWIVLSRRSEISALSKATKAARRIGAAALDKRPKFASRTPKSRENEQ
jgi:small-conductance mechanosensitive channel